MTTAVPSTTLSTKCSGPLVNAATGIPGFGLRGWGRVHGMGGRQAVHRPVSVEGNGRHILVSALVIAMHSKMGKYFWNSVSKGFVAQMKMDMNGRFFGA